MTPATVGVPYKLHGGAWLPRSGSSVAPSTTAVATAVHSTPTGPPTPSDGWQVLAADAFDSQHPLSALWYPNRNINGANGADMPGFASDEVEVLNSSQVALTAYGCELTAVCLKNSQSSSSYRSGCINSQTAPPGGPSVGFQWRPTVGQIIALEAVIKLPAMRGSDTGVCWGAHSDASGNSLEIDPIEQFNYGQNVAMTLAPWFGTVSGNSYNARRSFYVSDNPGLDPAHDGRSHRWTWVFDGTTKMVTIYLDGSSSFVAQDPTNNYARGAPTYAWPSTWATAVYIGVMFSYALRDPTNEGGGVTPPYVVGQGDKCVVRSFAAYANGSADTTQSIQGGLVAPGTVMV